jgi:hypothetical protein
MPFFSEVSLPRWRYHCLTKSHIGFKAYEKCGVIPQLELPLCLQGHLAYLVIVSSAFSHSLLGSQMPLICHLASLSQTSNS